MMMMDWDIMDPLISPKPDKDGYGINPNWSEEEGEEEKIEPWWKVAGKDELALLVAKKSVENIENCDLPRPLKIVRNYFDNDYVDDYDGKLSLSFEKSLRSIYNSETTYSSSSSSSTNNMSFKPSRLKTPTPSSNTNSRSNNSQLLKALCLSQTRAREAELAASKAFVEKEHAIKLLFKQASDVFAYKQWIRLLQIETIYLQHKIKDDDEDARVNEEKEEKKCCFCSYIAADISLAGASIGLILGWTLGWLLPMA